MVRCYNHLVIIVPGLGDKLHGLEYTSSLFNRANLGLIPYYCNWKDGEDFKTKLRGLLNLVQSVKTSTNKVSLIGTSAGGSGVFNAFCERKTTIYKVVNVCGRLKVGPTSGWSSFESRTSTSKAFAQSVRMAEANQRVLNEADRAKIMTIRPLWGDELVPANTVRVAGACNITIPSGEHGLSIALALTLFSGRIFDFLHAD